MLLTRPLPPQFLLPAWGRSWLAIAIDQQQRAYGSSLKEGRRDVTRNSSRAVTEDRSGGGVRILDNKGRTASRRLLLNQSEGDAQIPTVPRYRRPSPSSPHWNAIPPRSDQVQSTTHPPALPLRVSRKRKEEALYEPRNSNPAKNSDNEPQHIQAQAPPLERDLVDESAKSDVAATESAVKVGYSGDEEIRELSYSTLRASEEQQQRDGINIPQEPSQRSEKLINSSKSWSGPHLTPRTITFSGQSSVEREMPRTLLDPQLLENKSAQPESSKNHDKSRTLFEELFPDETKHTTTKKKRAQSDKLLSFDWQMDRQKERQRQRALRKPHSRSVPPYEDDIPRSPKSTVDDRKRRREASVLVLNCAPGTLAESDFFRLGPKGNHIQGWTSGIIKVIPGRHAQTLQTQDHYFILFNDNASARAYMDNIFKLYKLSSQAAYGEADWISAQALPDSLKRGEDVQSLIRGFSLIPSRSHLFLRLVNKPYRPAMLRLLEDGGPTAEVTRQSEAEDKVLVYSDFGNMALWELRKALLEDGRRRNLHWRIVGGENAILPLRSTPKGYQAEESSSTGKGFRKPERYVISFKDRLEARRFAREWHRRPFPLKSRSRQFEEPPTLNAEILW